jgi:hypothetical protein
LCYATAEATFVDHTGDNVGGEKGGIYLITKHPNDRDFIRIAKVPVGVHAHFEEGEMSRGSDNPFELLNVGAPYEGRIWTGANMAPNGKLIAMRTGDDVYYFSRLANVSVADALSSRPCPFIVPTSKNLRDERQYEAVTFVGNTLVAELSECENRATCEVPVYFYSFLSPVAPAPARSATPPIRSVYETLTFDDFSSG